MKVFIKIGVVIIIGILIPVCLLFSSNGVGGSKKNGFVRTLLTSNVRMQYTKVFDREFFNICGVVSNMIFLSAKNPEELYITDFKLSGLQKTRLNIRPDLIGKIGHIFITTVEYPNAFIYAGNVPLILKMSLLNQNSILRVLPKPSFSRAVQIADASFILRRFTDDYRNQIFCKFSAGLQKENNISIFNNDGGILSDGQLHYDNKNNLLVYLNFYNNNFTTFDTSLNLLGRYHTIDTTLTPPIEIAKQEYQGKSSMTNKSPFVVVNETSCVYNGILFVCSNLTADNEESTIHRDNLPIDLYELKTGKYIGSIYLPNRHDKFVRKIRVFNNNIIVLYSRRVSVYDFTLSY